MWHYALARIVVAARANGLRPIDGPFGEIGDLTGFEARARASAALGCEGKWAIHPSQIDVANSVFSPSKDEVDYAQRVLEAMSEAERCGAGAASLDGRMVDLASTRHAEVMVAKAGAIASRR
jgi:malyl-CoA/(S)-citramalyl-CoA lyase